MSCRNVAVLAAGVMLLAGCQAEETQLQASEIAYEPFETSFVETDCPEERCATVEVSAIHFPDSPELSAHVRTRLLLMGQGITDSETEWPTDSWEAFAEAFFEQARETRQYATHSASHVRLEAEAMARHDELLIIELDGYVYHAGQAHGMPLTEFMVIDERLRQVVTLDDMLLDDQEAAFYEALIRAHERWLRELEQDDGFAANWPLHESRNVAPLESAWAVRYNVYEIAPYAVGQPELHIPLDELEGIAKPRYLGRE
ncbi:RsiV family protein [Halomonas sp. LR3S48]|uniref:RsiV family protein n=1 Tax=Halomonas sp. LR3S48 TaxID=2982694 RepID=UPI0021E3E1F4|nr:RsiV family protein [Halomonas sp. LR3S48]UYG04443.1 RsiV family protein [Halomonas sp. LR3S48]